ncbi:NUDIX hydrolase [bacterium]|nr:NUDIX hydrolase [bacterium]
MRFCPLCATALETIELGDRPRLACPASACDFVHWDNPTPVVAAVVEHAGQVLIARNAEWPAGMFGLVTGFLEPREDPAEGVLREVHEELGVTGELGDLIGVYEFTPRNQVIIAYHVRTQGDIVLGEELVEYKLIAPDQCRVWPLATGLALRDWLRQRGHDPETVTFPRNN